MAAITKALAAIATLATTAVLAKATASITTEKTTLPRMVATSKQLAITKRWEQGKRS